MAPKRPTKQKGESRMDAALDAMHLYGFPRKLVRTTVQSLLKVYGGNEGWVFIEDSGYTLLIDTLLENQVNPSPQVGLIEANPGDDPNEVTPAGCSNKAILACCEAQTSDNDDTLLTNQALDTVLASSETGSQLLIKGVDTKPTTRELEKKCGSQLPIKDEDTISTTRKIGTALPFQSVDISSVNGGPVNKLLIRAASETFIKAASISAERKTECQPPRSLALRENHGPKSPELVTRLNHKRRKPCYGWISDDEEEEENLTKLKHTPPL
ncbi:unnamed protein product [Sphenostylis stenocarpa]|uniref:WIYLD domain-containing protein n=1 Tax=Sphenostylis stenocarpa TaxID=92480 RepID=A0AA86T8W3_9FABA|nr:unnamed protein product [Sphenostylis stenocarpa]